MLRGTRGRAGQASRLLLRRVYKQQTRTMTIGRKHQDVVVQVYGANTDVGKTVISTGLLRAAAASKEFGAVSYIKPLQTGGADGAFVKKHAPEGVSCHTLFEWSTSSSPHVAAALEGHKVSDDQILSALAAHLAPPAQGSEAHGPGFKLVETAGGVLSPGPSMPVRAQADIYRPLRLPVVLVGDGRLGGISATIAAYEALISRGYEVDAVALLETLTQDGPSLPPRALDNAAAIHSYLSTTLRRSTPVLSLPPIPTDLSIPLGPYFQAQDTRDAMDKLLQVCVSASSQRRARVSSMVSKACSLFWYPFTQHRGLVAEDVSIVDSASGDAYSLEGPMGQRTQLFDAAASWWTQGLGHGRPDVSLAVGEAAGRYGHVIFPGHVHEPALRLAELLLETGPGKGWASRVFFSDNGSTAMEIAMKMALKRAPPAHGKQVCVVSQSECYHGDTLGCMDASAPTVFNSGQHPWYTPRTLSLQPPTVAWVEGRLRIMVPEGVSSEARGAWHVAMERGQLFDFPHRDTTPLAQLYRASIESQLSSFSASHPSSVLGAVVLEPVLMGAAGMVWVDPLWQRLLIQEARSRGMVVVLDEIASGLYRLGTPSAAQLLQVEPDIACFGKTLTGGYLPLAVTLTTEHVFKAFEGDSKADALLHGHSYTANPVACSAAVHALHTYQHMAPAGDVWPKDRVVALSKRPSVQRVVSIGTVLGVELKAEEGGYSSNAAAAVVRQLKTLGIYARPLGSVVYLMASFETSRATTASLMQRLELAMDSVEQAEGSGATEGPAAIVI